MHHSISGDGSHNVAGFQMHVPKPIDPHDLQAVIASLAGRTGQA